MIKITKKDDKNFLVVISEENSEKEYAVYLDDDYHQNLSKNKISKEELIKRSFEFLLKKEPKESILSQFDLKIINNYFPEYETEIKKNLEQAGDS